MSNATEQICLNHPDGSQHIITVTISYGHSRIDLTAIYDHGTAKTLQGSVVAQWSAEYEKPIPDIDEGKVMIGDGRIELGAPILQGIGLGSLLMRPIILWIKAHRDEVPVVPINLSADDARTTKERDIRNRFYEKLGFRFDYKDDKSWGESVEIRSHSLIAPDVCLSGDWTFESISNVGCIFS